MSDTPASRFRRDGFVTVLSAEEQRAAYLPVELVKTEHSILADPPAIGWLRSMGEIVCLRDELETLLSEADEQDRSVINDAIGLVDYSIEDDRAFIAVFRADGDIPEGPKAFFVFGGPDVKVEPNITYAAGYMEPDDVKGGEYDAVFDETGRRYRFWVRYSLQEPGRETTQLEPTDDVDIEDLRQRLRNLAHEHVETLWEGFDPEDPLTCAVAISRWEWEHRWPKRPRWLSRRIHGTEPRIRK